MQFDPVLIGMGYYRSTTEVNYEDKENLLFYFFTDNHILFIYAVVRILQTGCHIMNALYWLSPPPQQQHHTQKPTTKISDNMAHLRFSLTYGKR
jgi:hypothetical protein